MAPVFSNPSWQPIVQQRGMLPIPGQPQFAPTTWQPIVQTRGALPIPGQPQPQAPHPAAPPAAQPAPSPLDATYLANVAAHDFDINNKVNAVNQQTGYAHTDLQNALAKLAYQQPRDELALNQRENHLGALLSSAASMNLGNLEHGYLGRQGDLNSGFQRAQAARDAEIQGLRGSIPIYDAQQYADAVARAAAAAAKDPSLGLGTGGTGAGTGSGTSAGTGKAQTPLQKLIASIANRPVKQIQPIQDLLPR